MGPSPSAEAPIGDSRRVTRARHQKPVRYKGPYCPRCDREWGGNSTTAIPTSRTRTCPPAHAAPTGAAVLPESPPSLCGTGTTTDPTFLRMCAVRLERRHLIGPIVTRGGPTGTAGPPFGRAWESLWHSGRTSRFTTLPTPSRNHAPDCRHRIGGRNTVMPPSLREVAARWARRMDRCYLSLPSAIGRSGSAQTLEPIASHGPRTMPSASDSSSSRKGSSIPSGGADGATQRMPTTPSSRTGVGFPRSEQRNTA